MCVKDAYSVPSYIKMSKKGEILNESDFPKDVKRGL